MRQYSDTNVVFVEHCYMISLMSYMPLHCILCQVVVRYADTYLETVLEPFSPINHEHENLIKFISQHQQLLNLPNQLKLINKYTAIVWNGRGIP
jgi:hypothetical protein